MKTILLSLSALHIMTLGLLGADEKILGTYVAAFTIEGEKPMPGTIAFTAEGDRISLIVHVRGERYQMPVTIRPIPTLAGPGAETNYVDSPNGRHFDGVSNSEDLINSVSLTGRFYNLEKGLGDGVMAIHAGGGVRSDGRGTKSGKIELIRFTLSKLNLETPSTKPPKKEVPETKRPQEKKAEGDRG